MDKKKKRTYLRIAAIIFWILLAIMAKSQRFKLEKDPYIYSILIVSFCGYLIYENFYRLPKISNTKEKTRENQLASLLKDLEKHQPQINADKVPLFLHPYILTAKKWGIENKILRNHLYESADKNELIKLKEIENHIEEIQNWIISDNESIEEKNAFELTLTAYNELGLWTWNNAHEHNTV